MVWIHQVNISGFDLNLLKVLDALLRERNVSRAAQRLSLSQPAVSNALGRLRELLDDPLLVRVGRSMQPTPRALGLELPIRDALARIEDSLNAGDLFDPASSQAHFTVAVTDYVELLCMPALMKRLAQVAPGVRLAIEPLTPTLPAEALDRGEIDLALGRFLEVPTRFQTRRWASEGLQVVLRKGHPLAQRPLDLPAFLQLRHLWVHGGQTRGMVDLWLQEQGLSREVVYTTPSYLQAPHVVAASDLAVVLPTRLARHFAALMPLALLDLPFALGPFQLDLVSVAQRQNDAALQWLIGEIAQLAEEQA
ncbi:DNA-binding transcriptional regulator, LysR family [Stutzerimonas balearica DSM 6083]|jgi:DNA-binding transcriptional LysR family regulator|uniref:DNA-binding transcriptional regulator, LysR family n=2 Tax=Stutzerimonas balearica TaxID=74829 RepID=A0ABY0R5P0_9GAMM|nr:DNA-binding transcriptional regulator, LysR family [Stutzerimonas balearica DSM 6083]